MRRTLADRPITNHSRFPALYRTDLLLHRIKELGWSKLETAGRANVKPETLRRVLMGTASRKTVWPISNVLGLDWSMVHNLELKKSEFHLAVRNEGVSGR